MSILAKLPLDLKESRNEEEERFGRLSPVQPAVSPDRLRGIFLTLNKLGSVRVDSLVLNRVSLELHPHNIAEV